MSRFVILEHRWNGIHWDLMLESGSGLRTWAVDAPIVPGVDLPARALPEHRIEYLEYEGPVSRGRGEVRRVDRGVYAIVTWETDQVVVELAGAQLAGELTLRRIEPEDAERWTLRLGAKVARSNSPGGSSN